jgi:hypothetical protein
LLIFNWDIITNKFGSFGNKIVIERGLCGVAGNNHRKNKGDKKNKNGRGNERGVEPLILLSFYHKDIQVIEAYLLSYVVNYKV